LVAGPRRAQTSDRHSRIDGPGMGEWAADP